ncbi:hypothetical protein [Paraconexibacter algicola]|nr:hypothetical protein [Paraconexibacter algicola]
MGCCIAIALVLGALRPALARLMPGRFATAELLAPPARRPVPGTDPVVAPERPAVAPRPEAAGPRRARRLRRPTLPSALIAAGFAWLLVTELLAHVLHVVAHSQLLHAPGPVLVVAGLALLVRDAYAPASRRPVPDTLRPLA